VHVCLFDSQAVYRADIPRQLVGDLHLVVGKIQSMLSAAACSTNGSSSPPISTFDRSEQPTGFTVGSDGQAEPVPQQPVRPPEFAPGIEVQAGPVVWLRSRVRFRLVIEVAVVGLVLLGWLVQLAWTTASPLWGLAVVVPVLVRAVWCALGRPESWHMLRTQRSRSAARARAERGAHDPPTEEFPVITEEMMRQHQ